MTLVCAPVARLFVVVAALGYAASAQAFVLYQDNFDGAAVSISGATLDINNYDPLLTWTAAPIFLADGTVTYATAADEGGMSIPFKPQDGATYTLTSVINNQGPGWVASGFAQVAATTALSANNRHSNTMAGYLWALHRNRIDGGQTDQQFFRGGGTGNGLAAASGELVAPGGNFELKVVLDTNNATAWAYEVFYNGTSFGGLQTLDAATTTTLRTNINHVGFSRDTANNAAAGPDIAAELVSFKLETSVTPGDVTGDGLVNIDDFNIIKANFFNTGMTRMQGDLNGGGVVDFADFRQWKVNAGAAFASVSLGAVPEPHTLAMVGLILAGLGIARKRRTVRS